MKIFTVAILGCGNRGSVYAKLMAEKEDCFKIVSVCDTNPIQLENINS